MPESIDPSLANPHRIYARPVRRTIPRVPARPEPIPYNPPHVVDGGQWSDAGYWRDDAEWEDAD